MNTKSILHTSRQPPWRSGGILATVLLISLLLSTYALASSGQGYAISWWTIDNGGATTPSTGGGFSLSGTIGQSDAGKMSSGGFGLAGGFWQSGVVAGEHRLYLPVVLRQSA
jgi:hypothetical protein